MQVSVGTLLAFTIVAISILILRYVPPNEIPLPLSFHESVESLSFHYISEEKDAELSKDLNGVNDNEKHSSGDGNSINYPLIREDSNLCNAFLLHGQLSYLCFIFAFTISTPCIFCRVAWHLGDLRLGTF